MRILIMKLTLPSLHRSLPWSYELCVFVRVEDVHLLRRNTQLKCKAILWVFILSDIYLSRTVAEHVAGERKNQRGVATTDFENEANGDSGSTLEMKGVLPWFVLASRRAFLSCLCCSSQPSTTYYFLNVHYFSSFVPIAQQAGQAVVPSCLSFNVSLGKTWQLSPVPVATAQSLAQSLLEKPT